MDSRRGKASGAWQVVGSALIAEQGHKEGWSARVGRKSR